MSDGAPIPNNVMIERICHTSVLQQVYAAPHGDFTMELRSRNNPATDASGSGSSDFNVTTKNPEMGIPRRELADCELRATVGGFRSDIVSLAEFTADAFNKEIDVGAIVLQSRSKPGSLTLNAAFYKAPKNAIKAYEKGLHAEGEDHLAEAQQYFQRAVTIYPNFTNAWFRLGSILQKNHQTDAARSAYTKATAIDAKFLPPFLSLAAMAYSAQNWTEVLNLTAHILHFDPVNYARVSGYILDLDAFDYEEAYFYDSVANYRLNKFEAAEKSARKAESLDTRPRFPRVHLLLADIFMQKNNYSGAIAEIRTYLDLVPRPENLAQLRDSLAKLEKLNAPASPTEKKNDPQ